MWCASWRKWILCTHTSRELTSAFESVKSSSLYFEFILTNMYFSFWMVYRIMFFFLVGFSCKIYSFLFAVHSLNLTFSTGLYSGYKLVDFDFFLKSESAGPASFMYILHHSCTSCSNFEEKLKRSPKPIPQ